MTGKDLFREIGMIKEEYVAEAENYKPSFIHRPVLQRSLATVACLVVCLGLYLGSRMIGSDTTMQAEDAAQTIRANDSQEYKNTTETYDSKEAVTATAPMEMQDVASNEEATGQYEKEQETTLQCFPMRATNQTTDATGENTRIETEKSELPPYESVGADKEQTSACLKEDMTNALEQVLPEFSEVKEKLAKYPTDYEAVLQMDAYIIVHGTVKKGQEKWDDFLLAVQNGETAEIDIVGFTVEGDPIITYLQFDGEAFLMVRDNTRDAWGNGAVTESKYSYLNILQDSDDTEAVLSGVPNLTREQLSSGAYETYMLFQRKTVQ